VSRFTAAFPIRSYSYEPASLFVRVNWRVPPTDLALPWSIGGVEITHHEVGNIVPQSE